MCVCVLGWSGWGCTDGSAALSYGRQVTATLLLTLSNLLFLPAVVVAAQRCYVAEASVYLFTLFFSTVTRTTRLMRVNRVMSGCSAVPVALDCDVYIHMTYVYMI